MDEYRAVDSRCAVDLAALGLPIAEEEALTILRRKGLRSIAFNVVEEARRHVGMAKYRRGAHPYEAPFEVDCSSYVKWLYGMRGIWLPRRSIQQRRYGQPVLHEQIQAGDLVFTSGFIDYYDTDPGDGVGHVGIAVSEQSVVHAANKKLGVVETPLDAFATLESFRGARRLIPNGRRVHTFMMPENREVETSDDFRWIILQNLPKP